MSRPGRFGGPGRGSIELFGGNPTLATRLRRIGAVPILRRRFEGSARARSVRWQSETCDVTPKFMETVEASMWLRSLRCHIEASAWCRNYGAPPKLARTLEAYDLTPKLPCDAGACNGPPTPRHGAEIAVRHRSLRCKLDPYGGPPIHRAGQIAAALRGLDRPLAPGRKRPGSANHRAPRDRTTDYILGLSGVICSVGGGVSGCCCRRRPRNGCRLNSASFSDRRP